MKTEEIINQLVGKQEYLQAFQTFFAKGTMTKKQQSTMKFDLERINKIMLYDQQITACETKLNTLIKERQAIAKKMLS